MPPPKHLLSQISIDVQPGDSHRLLEFLKCSECSELAQDAVETICCREILCSKCLIEKRANHCPKCQSTCKHTTSHLARRLIGTQPWQCPGCGKEGTRSDQAEHCLLCPQIEQVCPAEGCKFKGFPDAYIIHLTDAHKSQLLKNVERLFGPRSRGRNRNMLGSGDSSDQSIALGWPDSQIFMRSYELSRTHPTYTNKNYCQRPLNGPACDCCDGNCGPSNGCNCVDCMRLDLVTFGIGSEQRALVNREGVVSRMSSQTGHFYCGRRVMRHDPTTDGYCGPDNGNNCHACQKLDEQVHGRYATIAAEWNWALESLDVIDSVDNAEAFDY